jgi:hypothetical protein
MYLFLVVILSLAMYQFQAEALVVFPAMALE